MHDIGRELTEHLPTWNQLEVKQKALPDIEILAKWFDEQALDAQKYADEKETLEGKKLLAETFHELSQNKEITKERIAQAKSEIAGLIEHHDLDLLSKDQLENIVKYLESLLEPTTL